MLALRFARPLAQTVSRPTFFLRTMASISDVIKIDHRELEQYYNNILNAKTDDDKVRWQNQFTWELARHSIGEELVVYPLFEKALNDGKQMAEKDRQEHQQVKNLLYELQGLSPTDAKFESTIKQLVSVLAQHIKEEEQDDLIKLEGAITREQSAHTAKEFERTKKFVPTRSHPSAPDKPPFETVAGMLAAPIDKLGDLFRKFPKE